MNRNFEIARFFYPEIGISGYSSVDGTIEFCARVNSILDESMQVLDFGAGRAAWFEDDQCAYRKNLRDIRGRVSKLVGCDLDEAIYGNRSVDEQVLIRLGEPLPFDDESFDLIISDYTFEHFANPAEIAAEFRRILKPGGWICARTPNKYSYVSVLTRLIRNKRHGSVLKLAQPGRKEIDVFPTTFLLNTKRAIARHFPPEHFENFTYRYEAEPAYHFNNKLVFALMLALNRLLPAVLKVNLFVFLRKR